MLFRLLKFFAYVSLYSQLAKVGGYGGSMSLRLGYDNH